jgi:hypothetical protein
MAGCLRESLFSCCEWALETKDLSYGSDPLSLCGFLLGASAAYAKQQSLARLGRKGVDASARKVGDTKQFLGNRSKEGIE